MNSELLALFRSMIASLHANVRPHVASEHARLQLAAVLDVLGKLQGMTCWSPDALHEQAEALQAGTRAFEAHAAEACVELPVPPQGGPGGLPRAEARAVQLADWLFENPTLPAPLRTELDALLRAALRQQLLAERKRTPLTDFSAMTASADDRVG